MRVVRLVFLAAVAALSVPSAHAQNWSLDVAAIPGAVQGLFQDADQIIVSTRTGGYFAVRTGTTGNVAVERLGSYRRPAEPRRADMLPDGGVAQSANAIREAYLISPTSRYRHGVLGDAIEAGGLRVLTADGRRIDYSLDQAEVFEDLTPRLVDVDSDGQPEILVVRSSIDAGAAAALFGLRNGALELIADSEPIGRPNRWLNPVGVGDFDADGRREVAVVRTPHIGGILVLYGIADGKLVQKHEAKGFSNHFIGSRDLDLSVVADLNADGIADIALPSADRDAVRLVTFAGGKMTEIATIALPARVQTGLMYLAGGRGAIVFGLADGSLAILRRN